MSDIFLRMWPRQEVLQDKTDLIRGGLVRSGVIDQAIDEWKLVSNPPGKQMHEYIETVVKIEAGDQYFDQLSIMIEPLGQAPILTEDAEDFDCSERRNVVSVACGEGGAGDEWNKLR